MIFAEKARAAAEVKELPGILQAHTLGPPATVVEELLTMLELYALWVEGYEHCAKAVFVVRKAQLSSGANDIDAARRTAAPPREFGRRIEARLQGTSYIYYVYWLLDTTRIDAPADDVEARLRHLEHRSEPALDQEVR